MLKRIRWRDARTLDNSIIHKVAVWLGLVCSPSLHVGSALCTFHRRRPVQEGPRNTPKLSLVPPYNAYGNDDLCAIHGYEPVPPNCFRICGECGHAYATAEDLLRINHELWGDQFDVRAVESILDCPLCTHDW